MRNPALLVLLAVLLLPAAAAANDLFGVGVVTAFDGKQMAYIRKDTGHDDYAMCRTDCSKIQLGAKVRYATAMIMGGPNMEITYLGMSDGPVPPPPHTPNDGTDDGTGNVIRVKGLGTVLTWDARDHKKCRLKSDLGETLGCFCGNESTGEEITGCMKLRPGARVRWTAVKLIGNAYMARIDKYCGLAGANPPPPPPPAPKVPSGEVKSWDPAKRAGQMVRDGETQPVEFRLWPAFESLTPKSGDRLRWVAAEQYGTKFIWAAPLDTK